MRYHVTPTKMVIKKKKGEYNMCWQGCGKI